MVSTVSVKKTTQEKHVFLILKWWDFLADFPLKILSEQVIPSLISHRKSASLENSLMEGKQLEKQHQQKLDPPGSRDSSTP